MRVALLVVAVALAACGRDEREAEPTIESHGVSIQLPPGWEGRIVEPERGFATHVVAGNFEVPNAEDWLGPETSSAMSPESIYVWLAVQPVFEGMQGGRWLESRLPIRVDRSHLGNFEGLFSPVEAARWLMIDEHAIIAVVGFGSEGPDARAFEEANAVLATLSLDAGRRSSEGRRPLGGARSQRPHGRASRPSRGVMTVERRPAPQRPAQ